MDTLHPKHVRRHILTVLYKHFRKDPMEMLDPEDLLSDGLVTHDDLMWNVSYLNDLGLAEMMIGYHPTMFDAVRIGPAGVDLVENESEFNLRFPPKLEEAEEALAPISTLVERLLQEVDLCALDGERRQTLRRDIQFLRDEVARPAARYRREVFESVLDWIGGHGTDMDEELPSLGDLRKRIAELSAVNPEPPTAPKE